MILNTPSRRTLTADMHTANCQARIGLEPNYTHRATIVATISRDDRQQCTYTPECTHTHTLENIYIATSSTNVISMNMTNIT
jgi:hypothetical protein